MTVPSYVKLLRSETSWASLSSGSSIQNKLETAEGDESPVGLRTWETTQILNASPRHLGGFPNSLTAGTLGKPEKKRRFEILDVIAISCSLISLAVGILVISPHTGAGYSLGYNAQLIVIGFLLNVQTMCLKRIVPTLWLLLEARFGRSTIQNFEAILRNQIVEPKVDWIWRVVLLGLVALPIGLSAAYKNFQGGTRRVIIKDHGDPQYGLTGLPGTDPTSNFTLALTYMIGNPFLYAVLPMIVAKASHSVDPPGEEGPVQPYGFNVLLLTNSSVAFLDAPSKKYVTYIQNRLVNGETWRLSATINATVTRYNTTIDAARHEQSFWDTLKASGGMREDMSVRDDHELTLYQSSWSLETMSWMSRFAVVHCQQLRAGQQQGTPSAVPRPCYHVPNNTRGL